jgi:hypothetical protein
VNKILNLRDWIKDKVGGSNSNTTTTTTTTSTTTLYSGGGLSYLDISTRWWRFNNLTKPKERPSDIDRILFEQEKQEILEMVSPDTLNAMNDIENNLADIYRRNGWKIQPPYIGIDWITFPEERLVEIRAPYSRNINYSSGVSSIYIKIRPNDYNIEYPEGDSEGIKKEILMSREIRENIEDLIDIIKVHDVLDLDPRDQTPGNN